LRTGISAKDANGKKGVIADDAVAQHDQGLADIAVGKLGATK